MVFLFFFCSVQCPLTAAPSLIILFEAFAHLYSVAQEDGEATLISFDLFSLGAWEKLPKGKCLHRCQRETAGTLTKNIMPAREEKRPIERNHNPQASLKMETTQHWRALKQSNHPP